MKFTSYVTLLFLVCISSFGCDSQKGNSADSQSPATDSVLANKEAKDQSKTENQADVSKSDKDIAAKIDDNKSSENSNSGENEKASEVQKPATSTETVKKDEDKNATPVSAEKGEELASGDAAIETSDSENQNNGQEK